MKQVEKTFEKKTCECGHGNVTISENNTKIVANGVLVHTNPITWWFHCSNCRRLLFLYEINSKTINKLRKLILNCEDEKTLPRKMLVWDAHRASAVERTVFQILSENVGFGRYLVVNSEYEEDFEQGLKFNWMIYDNAEEIEETFVDKAISEKMKEKDKLIDELLKGEPTFEPAEYKDSPSCMDCAFEYYYEHEEPCSTCKDCSNFKEEKPSTGTLNGILGIFMPELGMNDRLDAIEKEIKKLKKKII